MVRGRIATPAVAFAVLVAACGTDAVGVDACRSIESARCRQAPACGIPLEPPFHTSGSDVDACIRFYNDACLHGLSTSPPGQSAIAQCVAAIQNDGCGVVAHPETDPACAWLVPAGTGTDAEADGAEGDGEAGGAESDGAAVDAAGSDGLSP